MTDIRTVRTKAFVRNPADQRDGTASSGITPATVPSSTRTTALLLTEDADELRSSVRTLGLSAGETHQKVHTHEWQVLSQQRGISNVTSLLSDVADMGFSWRDVAKLLGVSVPAVQKWRKGSTVSAENRSRLARLLAGCDLIVSHYYVQDVGQWFEMPIIEASPITPIDLWAAGRESLVFEYASQHLAPEETMDRFDADWRDRYSNEYETYMADDGDLSIRMKDR